MNKAEESRWDVQGSSWGFSPKDLDQVCERVASLGSKKNAPHKDDRVTLPFPFSFKLCHFYYLNIISLQMLRYPASTAHSWDVPKLMMFLLWLLLMNLIIGFFKSLQMT